jgi:hypothetical protein
MSPARSFAYTFVVVGFFLGAILGTIAGMICLNSCLKKLDRQRKESQDKRIAASRTDSIEGKFPDNTAS